MAQENRPATPDPLDDPQTLLEGGGGPAVDAAVLMYFGTVEEELEQHVVLREMVERLRESGDPRVAPALAAVLNRDEVYDRETPYMNEARIQSTQSRIVKNVLQIPATDAWFELMWPELTAEERVDAVLNAIRPNPDIHLLLTEDVMERVKEIEQSFRPAFYEHLLDDDVEYDWRSGWMRNVRSAMGRIMSVFPPTDGQRESILASPHALPRLLYLGVYGPPAEPWAIDLFTQLMDENADTHVVLTAVSSYSSRVAQQPEETKNQYRKILLKHGYRLIEDFREDRIDHWSRGALFGIASYIFKYGEHEDALEFLIVLRDFFNGYDVDQRDISDFLKRALPLNIDAGIKNVEFRINMWME